MDELRELDADSVARLQALWASVMRHVEALQHQRVGGKVVLEVSVSSKGVIEKSSRVQPPWEFPGV